MKKTEKFNPLDIFKAQIMNKSAEACSKLPTGLMVVFIVACVFITAFPYINQRVMVGLNNSLVQHYPGIGGALIDAAKQSGGFKIEDGHLVTKNSETMTFKSNDWYVVIGNVDPDKVIEQNQHVADEPMLILGDTSMAISNPASEMKIAGKYTILDSFSSNEILNASQNTEAIITLIQAIIFTLAVGDIPPAITSMLMLLLIQVVFFMLITAWLLSYSKNKVSITADKFKDYGFLASLKIMSVVALGPSLLVSAIAYYKPQFGLSLGWILYAIIVGGRAVAIYLKRIKGKPVINVA